MSKLTFENMKTKILLKRDCLYTNLNVTPNTAGSYSLKEDSFSSWYTCKKRKVHENKKV